MRLRIRQASRTWPIPLYSVTCPECGLLTVTAGWRYAHHVTVPQHIAVHRSRP